MSVVNCEPRLTGWAFVGTHKNGDGWQHIIRGLRVIASIDNTIEEGLLNHISVSKERGLPSDYEMAFVAESFDMPTNSEDNDGSDGTARHLWSTVDEPQP